LHSSVIYATDFNNWWTLLHLFHRSFFSRFVIWVQRSISFYTVDFYWIIKSCSLIIFSIWIVYIIVYWSSLTCDSHDLSLIPWTFKIRIGILLKFGFLASLIFQDFVLLEMRRRTTFIRIKFLFLVTPRCSGVPFRILLKSWFWFVISKNLFIISNN
jgi:hypothetical protein